jgi:hypothetical protein
MPSAKIFSPILSVVDHRHARALRLARVEAADDELAGIAADLGRRHQVLAMDGARPFIVALHAGALAAQHRAGQRITAAAIASGEAVAGSQRHREAAPARLGALGIGDALDGAGGVLGFGGLRQQRLGCRPPLVVEIEVGPAMRQQFLRGDAAYRILRHRARHIDGALRQRAQRGGREIGRGDEGLALAHEHAQPEVAALAALELLALAHALGDRDRLAVDIERVRGIAAGGLRPFQQVGEQVAVRRARRTLPGRRLPRGLLRVGLFRFGHDAVLRANRPSRRGRRAGQGPA